MAIRHSQDSKVLTSTAPFTKLVKEFGDQDWTCLDWRHLRAPLIVPPQVTWGDLIMATNPDYSDMEPPLLCLLGRVGMNAAYGGEYVPAQEDLQTRNKVANHRFTTECPPDYLGTPSRPRRTLT